MDILFIPGKWVVTGAAFLWVIARGIMYLGIQLRNAQGSSQKNGAPMCQKRALDERYSNVSLNMWFGIGIRVVNHIFCPTHYLALGGNGGFIYLVFYNLLFCHTFSYK